MPPNCDPEPDPKIDIALRWVFSTHLSAGILFEALWDRFFALFWLALPPFSHSEGPPARLLTPRVRTWTSQKLSGATAPRLLHHLHYYRYYYCFFFCFCFFFFFFFYFCDYSCYSFSKTQALSCGSAALAVRP